VEGCDQDTSRDGATQAAPSPGHARRVSVRLRPTSIAAEQARRALQRLALPSPLADEAELLVSEVVTNSIRHAKLGPGDLIHLTADWSGTRLRVHVRDGGRNAHRAAVSGSIRPPSGAESGWGLYLVDRLASRWGTTADGHWFELRADRRRPGA
jgi:anti-sigma regulatory factor (Ser/Thr protein kinase)